MRIKGIKWVGVCVADWPSSLSFYRDVLGLTISSEGDLSTAKTQQVRFAELTTESGDFVELFDHNLPEHDLFSAPVLGFLVDDLGGTRAELERKGVAFIGPIYYGKDWEWSYFRSPEGHVYQLMAKSGTDAGLRKG